MHKNNKVDYFKLSIEQEKLTTLNFNYLSEDVENWWKSLSPLTPLRLAKFELANLILKKTLPEDMQYFDQLGINNIAAVTITNIFTTDCHRLARVTHETFSELFGLNDIKYAYEEHKKFIS